MLGGAAVLAVSAPLLAACAGGDDDVKAPDAGTELSPSADVPVGGGVILGDDNVVITQPTEGDFKAFSATCTHQSCQVVSVDKTINCDCHGSKFSITDGSVADGPATESLPEVKITVKDGTITTV
ncbi:Rieske (2Fe-2S) protein [Nocardioides sp. Root151]|uniref:Rieske (2Fe-2S) protein n=2 Tax=Nocardioides TaxID=1839 RepID=UPI0006F59355|nr:Rieske (2Fe-2S) protein [Nocardioides sp. Root151]KQY64347.1 hypothetical protein ASD30_05235 [Nocardioides sp. Root140]KQZ70262.1 hypothetical protein ASD66_11500 [Nocardioides sp. Root151]KRF18118.1 hypothetical protein ASH02_00620 [Nocardioides sp. Soil796]